MTTPGPEHYFSAQPSAAAHPQRLELTLRGHAVSVTTSGGVFSHERVDLGTRVLLREAPTLPADGLLLDLGCGWGPIALAMGLESPEATVWAVDVNERAVELTRANAAALGLRTVRAGRPEDVPADLTFDVIWSNPPIRVGKVALHALLLHWLPRLRLGGSAYLVVQRNLGADSLQAWLATALAGTGSQYDVSRRSSAKGYRLLQVDRRT